MSYPEIKPNREIQTQSEKNRDANQFTENAACTVSYSHQERANVFKCCLNVFWFEQGIMPAHHFCRAFAHRSANLAEPEAITATGTFYAKRNFEGISGKQEKQAFLPLTTRGLSDTSCRRHQTLRRLRQQRSPCWCHQPCQ